MKRIFYFLIIIASLGVALGSSCKKDKPDPPVVVKDTLKILSFKFHALNPVVEATIDHNQLKINALIPRTANIKNQAITVEFTQGATLTPPSGYSYDFSNPLEFTLKKDLETVKYMVTVGYSASDKNELLSVSFPDLLRHGIISGNNITLEVPFGTNLNDVLIEMSVSEYASVIPASGSLVNLTNPLIITVTAENGNQKSYQLNTTVLPQETGVRAFWIPDATHTTFMTSYEQIQEGVALAKELNFNTLYVCAWAKTRTLYPSQVLAANSTYADNREGMFTPGYTGISGDPLTDLIEVAHVQGLKVILWYEYGFMARWGGAPTPSNDKILAVHPDWVGINNQGQPSNYNNSDYYYNAYNPEVQQFLLDLVMEAVNNYNIDGVQGDDRMPAMPANSGYDTYTVNRYKSEHGGASPPNDFSNSQWVRWRVNILNQFGVDLYNTVKAAKPGVLVTNSPNPYPWSFTNLMQEWPAWLDAGAVEILSVQCYRYTITGYQSTINEVLSYFTSHGDDNKLRLAPGLILYGSAGLTDPNLIYQQMNYNRSVGITGESFFYDVPLKDARIKKVIKAMYAGPALFPAF